MQISPDAIAALPDEQWDRVERIARRADPLFLWEQLDRFFGHDSVTDEDVTDGLRSIYAARMHKDWRLPSAVRIAEMAPAQPTLQRELRQLGLVAN